MQKVLDFLEKYCQWVAVGIAAAFFLFALWQFLPGISAPVSVPIGNATLSPGEVDPHILENDVEPLRGAMGGTAGFTAAVPPYTKTFTAELDGVASPRSAAKGIDPMILAGSEKPFKLPENIKIDPAAISDPANNNNGGNRVAALPTPPAAILDPVATTGFAQIPANYVYGMVPPPAPVPAAPGQPAPAAAPTTDITWVRVPYTIPMRKLANSFQQVGIPASVNKTRILAVELIRQQQLPGNSWGPEEVVKTLPTVQLQPMPPANAQPPVMLNYATWADANELPIVQPPFFPFMGGEDPNVSKPVEVAPAADVFDPTTYPPNASLDKLTADQKKAVLKARQEAAAVRKAAQPKQTPQPRGGRGPRGPRGGEGMPPGGSGGFGGEPRQALPPAGGAFATPSTFAVPATFQNRPPVGAGGPYGPRGPYGPNGPGSFPGEPPEGMMPGGENFPPQQVQGQVISLGQLPQPPFDPLQTQADIQGVAWDVDAKADATFRYRIRYSLFNPIYQSQNIAVNQQLAQQFAIVGEDNVWSEPIEIAPLTHVFLASQPRANTPVRFVVYHWQNGKVHRSNQQFTPGDSVGKVDGDIDYRTPWTLVEVRTDSSATEPYAVLMNSEGRLRRQTFSADKDSADQKKLAQQVDVGTAAVGATANAGGPYGAPPAP